MNHKFESTVLHGSTSPQDAPQTDGDGRFLSNADCQTLVQRAVAFSVGGGETTLELDSTWTGNLRWARNQVSTGGDVRDNELTIQRDIRGAVGVSGMNQVDDVHLVTALRRAERLAHLRHENPQSALRSQFIEPYSHPKIWSDTTYHLDAASRASGMRSLVQPAAAAGMQSAGYLQVSAHGRSTMDGERVWYYPYTLAQYSVTVRDSEGKGSGWAGVDDNDWSRIDAATLSAIALDKCLKSRNPVAVEPGRYTTILEPQAVCDFVKILFTPSTLDRENAEAGERQNLGDSPYFTGRPSPYATGRGVSRIGERVIDARLSVSSDPMDPALGFPPFLRWQVFHPATWIKDGVLQELSYFRSYAVKKLSKNTGGLPATGSFRISVTGETSSIDDMIATTKRGLLVTRFWGIPPIALDPASMLLTGYTRDGVWLIEHGKIAKPVKNFRFTESPLFMLNSVEQVGVPQRVFRPESPDRLPDGYAPVIVPALKVRDFNFTALSDAI
jgi:predicted Zn-dependent protease